MKVDVFIEKIKKELMDYENKFNIKLVDKFEKRFFEILNDNNATKYNVENDEIFPNKYWKDDEINIGAIADNYYLSVVENNETEFWYSLFNGN